MLDTSCMIPAIIILLFVIVIDCGYPPHQDFAGTVDFENTTYSSSALYSCPGNCSSSISVCQDDGMWTEINISCYSKYTY